MMSTMISGQPFRTEPTEPAEPSVAVQPPAQTGDLLLDDPQRWAQFSEPATSAGPGLWKSRVTVQGMYCAACSVTVEAALCAVPGVVEANVNAATGRAWVTWQEGQTRPSQWLAAIKRSGYHASAQRGTDVVELARKQQRAMLWRWLVAGFCMMQVMMYAWPNYSAQAGEIDLDSDRLLRWASWLLTLPVLLFSSGPFFSGAWGSLKQGRVSMDLPVALGILIAFGVSTIASFDPRGAFGHELYFDSLTMFVFILLSGRWIESGMRTRTAGALNGMADQLPLGASRLRADGCAEIIPLDQVRQGDRLRVLPGEAFPVDGLVLSGQSWADEALLTGESQPLAKRPGDAVTAGSINLSQTLEVRAERIGNDTRYAQILELMERSSQLKTRTVQIADRIAQPFLVVVLCIAAAAFVWWWPSDQHRAWLAAIAVLIVTCPCALALAAPMALLSCAGALARNGVLVRDLGAIEKLSTIDTIVFDKTGTLTADSIEITGIQALRSIETEKLLALAGALASQSLHPVSKALAKAARESKTAFEGLAVRVTEIAGKGLEGQVQLDGQHAGPESYRLGTLEYCSQASSDSSLGLACTENQQRVFLGDKDGLLACFFLKETLRADAQLALQQLQQMGLRLGIYSGDKPAAVQAVVAALGLDTAQIELRSACQPQDKLQALAAQQAQGHRLAMVGDGINDGPVLAGANASFSFSRGAALAQVKADFLLLQPNLMQVPEAIRHARKAMQIVRQNLAWAVIYNLIAIPLALSGHLTPWVAGLGMALSSLVVIVNAARLRQTAHA